MENSNLIEKYTYRVEWSEEDKLHLGRCLEFPSLIAHGSTAKGALLEIQIVVKEAITWMQEENKEIPQPFGLSEMVKAALKASGEL